MGNSNRKEIAEAADNAMLDLARDFDMLKEMIDFLVNLRGTLDQRQFERVYRYTTDLQRRIYDDVMTKNRSAMSRVSNVLKIISKKSKKNLNKKWKIDSYLEEEKSVISANSGHFLGSLEQDKITNRPTLNPTNNPRNERSTPTESTPLLCQDDVQGNKDKIEIEDNKIVIERTEKKPHETCLTTTLEVLQSSGTEPNSISEEYLSRIEELQSDNDVLKQRFIQLQAANDMLNQRLIQLQETIDSLQEKSENYTVIQKEVLALKEEKTKTECIVTSLEEKLAHKDEHIQKEMKKNERLEKTIGTLNIRLEENKVQLQNVTASFNCMQKEKTTADEKAKELQLTISNAQEDFMKIEAKLEYERQQHEVKIKDINLILEENYQHLKESRGLIEDLTQDKIKHEAILLDLQLRNHALEDKCQSLIEDNKILNKRLSEQNILRVQVYSPSQSGTMVAVENEMMRLIQTKLENRASEFKFVKCIDIADVNQNLPTLLLCINTSRLGTDVSTMVQKFQTNSKMAVIVFHHKDAHALPNESSSRVLVGQEFKQLGGIFDLAFLSDKGLYTCNMNKENISKLIEFITQLLQPHLPSVK